MDWTGWTGQVGLESPFSERDESEGHLLVGCSGCNHLQSALICCYGLLSIFSCSTSEIQVYWTSWGSHMSCPHNLPSVLLLRSHDPPLAKWLFREGDQRPGSETRLRTLVFTSFLSPSQTHQASKIFFCIRKMKRPLRFGPVLSRARTSTFAISSLFSMDLQTSLFHLIVSHEAKLKT